MTYTWTKIIRIKHFPTALIENVTPQSYSDISFSIAEVKRHLK